MPIFLLQTLASLAAASFAMTVGSVLLRIWWNLVLHSVALHVEHFGHSVMSQARHVTAAASVFVATPCCLRTPRFFGSVLHSEHSDRHIFRDWLSALGFWPALLRGALHLRSHTCDYRLHHIATR